MRKNGSPPNSMKDNQWVEDRMYRRYVRVSLKSGFDVGLIKSRSYIVRNSIC